MLELTAATEPGPFLPQTIQMASGIQHQAAALVAGLQATGAGGL